MFYYKLDKPQVKRNVVSSTANLLHKLNREFTNDLKLWISGKNEILGKFQILLKT